jgi:two-component sensor histidine kinase
MPQPLPLDLSRMNRALAGLWALFWMLMIVVAVQDSRGDKGIQWWEPYVWEGSSCVVATFWLWLSRRADRRWQHLLDEPLRWFGRHLVWLPLVALTFIIVVYPIRHGVYALTTETYEHDPWAYLFFYESVKIALFASLWLCIGFGLESFVSWREERERLLKLQKHLAESQLARLRAQLQPHFLFNALNTISSIMQVDIARADKLLTQLADLLRASLQTSDNHTTSLREELSVLRLYAAIMQERFADRVSLNWTIADDTLDATVPAMLLQPLLENAFKHGVERSSLPVAITIDAHREGAMLSIIIRNAGAALTPPSNDGIGTGIGVTNSRERLSLLFGPDGKLDLAQDGDGVASRVSLPFQSYST